MSAITNTPVNRNFLASSNFRMALQRAPSLNFFLQGISIPGLSFEGSIDVPTPFVKIPIPGDHINYAPLTVEFIVDEDLTNYLEIWNWIISIAGPESIDPTSTDRLDNKLVTDYNSRARSDIKLMILSSAKNPNLEVTFYDAFPSSLGQLNFTTVSSDISYIQCSVTFDYIKYKIEKYS
jgi:hypothetical protein